MAKYMKNKGEMKENDSKISVAGPPSAVLKCPKTPVSCWPIRRPFWDNHNCYLEIMVL